MNNTKARSFAKNLAGGHSRRALLCSVLSLSLAIAPLANANAGCLGFFAGKTTSTQAAGITERADKEAPLRELIGADRVTRKPGRVRSLLARVRQFRAPIDYNAEIAETLKQKFVEELRAGKIIDPTGLKTLNEKIAWIDANGVVLGKNARSGRADSQPRHWFENGGDIFQLAQFMREAAQKDQRAVVKILKNVEFSDKLSWSQADRLAVRLYILTHFDPSNYGLLSLFKSSWKNGVKTTWDKGVSDLIRYRVGMSLARHGLVAGLKQQGMLAEKSSTDRLKEGAKKWALPIDIAYSIARSTVAFWVPHTLASHITATIAPMLPANDMVQLAAVVGPGALQFFLPWIAVRTPRLMQKSRDVAPVVEERLLERGFGDEKVSAYADAIYKRNANIQKATVTAVHVLGALMIPILAGLLWDDAKFFGLLIYHQYYPVDEAKEIAEEKATEKPVFTPPQRAQLIKDIYKAERELRLSMIEMDDVSPDEHQTNIDTVDADLKESKEYERLQSLPDSQLIAIAQGGGQEAVAEAEQ